MSLNKATTEGKTINYKLNYFTKIIYKFSLKMSVSTTEEKKCPRIIQVMKDARYVNKLLNFSTFLNLKMHWRLSTILETSNKSVWRDVFWYVKACIFWKCIQYSIHWDKTQILKKIPFGLNKRYKKCPLFLSRALTHYSFIFHLRFLYELKHKVHLSKTVCGIFHFLFCFVFIKVYIFVQQNAWALWL